MIGIHYGQPFFSLVVVASMLRAGVRDPQVVELLYLLISLPAVVLAAGMASGGRVRAALIHTAQILAGVTATVAAVDLFVAPIFAGVFGTEAAAVVQLLLAITVLCWQLIVRGQPGYVVKV